MADEAGEQQTADLPAIRARIENVVLSLQIVEAVIVVASEALAQQAVQYDPEIALVLMRCASDPLHNELKELQAIIETIPSSGELGAAEDDEGGEGGHETDDD